MHRKESFLAHPYWNWSSLNIEHTRVLPSWLGATGGVSPRHLENFHTATQVGILYIEVGCSPESIKDALSFSWREFFTTPGGTSTRSIVELMGSNLVWMVWNYKLCVWRERHLGGITLLPGEEVYSFPLFHSLILLFFFHRRGLHTLLRLLGGSCSDSALLSGSLSPSLWLLAPPSARVSSGSVDVSPSAPPESWLAPPSARVSSGSVDGLPFGSSRVVASSTISKGKFRFSRCLPFGSSRVVASSTISKGKFRFSRCLPFGYSESWLAPPSVQPASCSFSSFCQ